MVLQVQRSIREIRRLRGKFNRLSLKVQQVEEDQRPNQGKFNRLSLKVQLVEEDQRPNQVKFNRLTIAAEDKSQLRVFLYREDWSFPSHFFQDL